MTVYPPRNGSTRSPHRLLLAQRAMASFPPQRSPRSFQRQQGHEQESYPRRYRNLPHPFGTQKAVLYQARILSGQLLLLLVPHDLGSYRRYRVRLCPTQCITAYALQCQSRAEQILGINGDSITSIHLFLFLFQLVPFFSLSLNASFVMYHIHEASWPSGGSVSPTTELESRIL